MPRENNSESEEQVQDEAELIQELLAPKEEEESKEITAMEPGSDHMGLIRYDPLRHYLLEISRYEPLSYEEEQRLARLFRDKQDVNAARKLVTSNLKLVVKIAFLYNKVYSNLMDLIQEGNIGLLQAVKKFDPERGTRLPRKTSTLPAASSIPERCASGSSEPGCVRTWRWAPTAAPA